MTSSFQKAKYWVIHYPILLLQKRVSIHLDSLTSLYPDRYKLPIREPETPLLSYRFRSNQNQEEHRIYKLVCGKTEEYTPINKNWTPVITHCLLDNPSIASLIIGVLPFILLAIFLLFGILIREPLRKLYHRLEHKRIDLERTAEMNEIFHMESEIRQITGENPTHHTVYDFVHPITLFNRSYHYGQTMQSYLPRIWTLETASIPSKRVLRQIREKS